MSLINEALKKAQRQRAAEASASANVPEGPSTQPEPVHAPAIPLPAKRRKHVGAQSVVLITIGSILLLLVGGAAAFILFSPSESPAVIAAAHPAPAPQPVLPQPVLPAPVSPPPVEPVPTVILPPKPPVVVTPNVPPVTTPKPEQIIPAPVFVAPTPPTPVEEPTQAPKPDPRIYVFLDKIRVAGIRASKTDPRVLMNDRMFRIGDVVDNQLQLRLTGISSLALTFTDANGIVYNRNF